MAKHAHLRRGLALISGRGWRRRRDSLRLLVFTRNGLDTEGRADPSGQSKSIFNAIEYRVLLGSAAISLVIFEDTVETDHRSES